MNSYRDLEIFVQSERLAIEVHKTSLNLPKFELYEEGSQVRRSSKSVTAMIVEGCARKRYRADFIKFLTYAQAECDETIIHLRFLAQTNSGSDHGVLNALIGEYDSLSKQINKFIQWVESNMK